MIWSATMSDRFSSAVCSAATVAYSELTMSIPASDPAVASSTTVPFASVDQLVARAQAYAARASPRGRCGGRSGDIVVERDVEPIAALPLACFAQAVDQLVAHQPARLAVDRRRPRPSAGSPRPGPTLRRRTADAGRTRRAPCSAGAGASAAHHATIFTSRSGTTITLRGAAPQLALDLVGGQRERLGRRPVEPARRGQRVAQLAVDLHRQRHLIVDQQRRIEARPGGIGDHSALAERCPAFLGEVRRRRREQAGSTSRIASCAGRPTARLSRWRWSARRAGRPPC